ncbi:MAG: hypothetical protein M3O88_04120 [Actinomycetota bacterium]|nr:hypothetical protein [Actinomycetota bacterium]
MNARVSVAAVANEEATEPAVASSPPVVMVLWHDAWADSEQHDPQEWRSVYIVQTIGFLVREEPDVVSIAQEILPEDDGFRAVTHIPRGMIENLTWLSADSTAGSSTLA